MAKIDRLTGNVEAFASQEAATERTVFGDVTESDTLDANLNADFKRGWGVIAAGAKPPKQFFNGALFTATQLSAYLHQMGIAEYDAAQEYHTGSFANVGGLLFKSKTDNNIGNALTDRANWEFPKGLELGSIAELKLIENAAVGDYASAWRNGVLVRFQLVTDTGQADGFGLIQGDGVVWAVVSTGSVNVNSFGASVVQTAAQNTPAIQAAINYCSNNELVFVDFEKGEYLFDNLYLHYDATDNPDFNQISQEQGRIILRGKGRNTHGGFINGYVRGTQLRSDSSVGEASIYGLDGQMVRIENMTLVSDNTTKAVKFDTCPQYSGFSNVLVEQRGSGGGVEVVDVWNFAAENVFINGAGKATSLGDGLYVYNENVGAGFISLDVINVNAFNNSVVLGHKDRSSAARIHGIQANNVQGGEAVTGVTIGGGVASSQMRIHAEDNDLGVCIINGAKNVEVMITTSGNGKDVEVGSTVATENHYSNITVMGEFISSDASEFVEVFTSSNTENLTFYKPKFTGDGTNTAFKLQDANHHNLSIIEPVYSSISTEIDNPHRVQLLIEEQREVRRTVNTGGTLAEVPYQFTQESSTGAQAVQSLNQKDGDQPFFELITPITPTTNLNSINTTNAAGSVTGPSDGSWTFSRMAKIRVTDGDGTTDYWMPLFEAV